MTKPSPVLAKVLSLQTEMRSRFVERDNEIEGVLLAALAGEHCLLLGPAGTGKSALARGLAESLTGSSYFEWLMTRFTTPEELFGPVSMTGLKADRFVRVTRGKLPEANIAFLDEVFKANSAVLNATLAVLNERVYHNDGAPMQVPLITCIGASNELPEGPELAALWDRFVLRYWTKYVDQIESFESILVSGTGKGTVQITNSEWDAAKAEVSAVALGKTVITSLFGLRKGLQGQGIEASDRRWRKAAQLLKAAAWMDGCAEVSEEHFGVLSACLWNTPEQAPMVRQAVGSFASQELSTATSLYDAVIELIQDLPSNGDDDYTSRATPVVREMKKAIERLTSLHGSAKSAGSKKKIDSYRADISARGAVIVENTKKAMGF